VTVKVLLHLEGALGWVFGIVWTRAVQFGGEHQSIKALVVLLVEDKRVLNVFTFNQAPDPNGSYSMLFELHFCDGGVVHT
jgi:hypothetical protein